MHSQEQKSRAGPASMGVHGHKNGRCRKLLPRDSLSLSLSAEPVTTRSLLSGRPGIPKSVARRARMCGQRVVVLRHFDVGRPCFVMRDVSGNLLLLCRFVRRAKLL